MPSLSWQQYTQTRRTSIQEDVEIVNCVSQKGKSTRTHTHTNTTKSNKYTNESCRVIFGDESELKISCMARARDKANELVDNDGKGFDYYPRAIQSTAMALGN